jgi:hypothetical protein
LAKAWLFELGRQGGKVKSEAKFQASRENGKQGGRPRKKSLIVNDVVTFAEEKRHNYFSTEILVLSKPGEDAEQLIERF